MLDRQTTHAKAGVSAMATVWAKEPARYGIRSAAIAPGFIETEMVAGMKPEALEKMSSGIPLKRLGEPRSCSCYVYNGKRLLRVAW